MDRECNRIYCAIDLKSFYASVECRELHLDPLKTNLVVADLSRTEKTVCLAVSPSLKSYGIPGRARLFETIERVKRANAERLLRAPRRKFIGKSYDADELKADPSLELSFLVVPPHMEMYMEYSTWIYNTYLKYVAPEDVHVYSIDEVFIDLTDYMKLYQMNAHELVRTMIQSVLDETGVTATAGIGTNMYLAKVAMDIVAKKMPPDKDGVRIAELDEHSYREQLWDHRPLTDFWRVGRGYQKKLESSGLYTMGDIAKCSIGSERDFYNEDLLYKMFGINAELLIDHAWGWEPCRISDIKAYRPENSSLSSGQVLHCPYEVEKARIITQEMADALALDLFEKRLVADQIVLTIGYDIENLTDPERRKAYKGKIIKDHYGREVPEHSHGSINLEQASSSSSEFVKYSAKLFDRIVRPGLLVRRITVVANHAIPEGKKEEKPAVEQLSLFVDYETREKEKQQREEQLEKEKRAQEAVLAIKNRFGKNAILKGMNLQEGATARDRNEQIGGHKKG